MTHAAGLAGPLTYADADSPLASWTTLAKRLTSKVLRTS